MSTSLVRKTDRISPQLQAIVDLHSNKPLAQYVLQLNPLDLEGTKMMLSVLQQIEDSCWDQYGRALTKEELLSALDKLIKDSNARQRIVQLYQQRHQLQLEAP